MALDGVGEDAIHHRDRQSVNLGLAVGVEQVMLGGLLRGEGYALKTKPLAVLGPGDRVLGGGPEDVL